MLKTLNYDSSLYTPTSSLQRSLPNSEIPKKTMTSLVSKAPLNNRTSSPSPFNERQISSGLSNIYGTDSRSPRPTNNERETNASHNPHWNGTYRNFDTFNTVSSSKFPVSKIKHGKSSNSNDSGSEIDGYTRVNGVQLKPMTKIDQSNGEKNYNIPPEQRKVDEIKSIQPSPAPINRSYLIRMKRKHKNKISANVSGTKFDLIKNVVESIGCKIAPDENFNCNLIWDDTKVSVESISELKSFQRYNHFVAMSEISRKDALARNMLKMYKVLPNEFDFVPKTWIMPSDYSQLLSYSIDMKKAQQKRTFILKPSNAAMGHGIKLYRNIEKIQPTDNFIVQEYIANPYLLDKYKFDLRIYALVTSCDPLRAFIFNNGLVRLGTEKYQEPHESNIDHLYMHLTNYSVNKHSNLFGQTDDAGTTGSKRSLKFLFDHFNRNNIDASKVWKNIQDVILKTLLVAEPYLFHTYKMCRPGQMPGTESVCYEILGFDILLDESLKPWVLEVNRSPSFGATQQIDFDIKSKLLVDSFELLHLRASDRERCHNQEKTEAKKRLYNLNGNSKAEAMAEHSTSSKVNTFSSNYITNSNNLSNFSTKQNNNKMLKTKESRKMELIEQIKMLRREQRRQEYENRNLGNFSRLFPIDDKYDMDHYLNLLNTSFNLFYPIGKHVQWRKNYERIKEDELIEELVECDEHNKNYDKYEQMKVYDQYLRDDYMTTESEDETVDSEDERYGESRYNHHHKHKQENYNEATQKTREQDKYNQRGEYSKEVIRHAHSENRYCNRNDNDEFTYRNDHDSMNIDQKSQPKAAMSTVINNEHVKSNRINTLMNAVSSTPPLTIRSSRTVLNSIDKLALNNNEIFEKESSITAQNLLKQITHHQNKQKNNHSQNKHTSRSLQDSMHSVHSHRATNKDIDEEISSNNMGMLTIAALKLLNQLEIKFPGKSTEDTKHMLQRIYVQLEHYRPKLGNYWMVKLDDTKRNKILNIVKSNIIVILQKVFQVINVDNLRLFKIFAKLLNRMLWMHGQGLWHCFNTSNNSSWETIFSKSTLNITENELKCCYRIIDLCKDCVIIVYQYAFEQNNHDNKSTESSNNSNKTTSTSKLTSSFQKYKHASANNLAYKPRYK